jgi:hypothetical protein
MTADVGFSVSTFAAEGACVGQHDRVCGAGFDDEGSVEDGGLDTSAGDPGETGGNVEAEGRFNVFRQGTLDESPLFEG